MSTLVLLAAKVVAAGVAFACTPVSVWDGDGPIRCAEGPKVRLAAIAAREKDGSCRQGHPCPRASGIVARDRLVQLLGGSRGMTRDGHVLVRSRALACLSRGPDEYAHTVVWCSMPGAAGQRGDVSCLQLRAGVVARWPRYGGATVCRLTA